MMHNLTRLLADWWNKFKQGSSALSILEDDIVVFVVGPTGSGKSWFIKEATRADSLVKSSRDYHPFTKKVQAIRCELTDEAKIDLRKEGIKSIVFVDTPSFLTACDDIDAQKEVRTWVEQIERRPRCVGVIYMHRIETDPVIEPIQNHLRELTAIPPLGNSHSSVRLHIVISHDTASGNVSEVKIKKHGSSLGTQMDTLIESESRWKPSMHHVHFHGEPEVAWRAVERLLTTGGGTNRGVAGLGRSQEEPEGQCRGLQGGVEQ
ncbi:hypothetical protein L210DRAFT_3574204 [Boletus edulis BED1]|uniref:G domain-containing protein n=1 Tax=Boletus edulis BED1 TaxID=1328754 RepID=A0AAD4G6G2_BOLED|nr:hypothetical protein L210DRAFT_3574204 [Boletus edulis BED1]